MVAVVVAVVVATHFAIERTASSIVLAISKFHVPYFPIVLFVDLESEGIVMEKSTTRKRWWMAYFWRCVNDERVLVVAR